MTSRLDWKGALFDSRAVPSGRIAVGPGYVLLAAVALTALSTVVPLQISYPARRPAYGELIALNAFYWFSWAALTPLGAWLALRFRFGREAWLRALAVHVPAALLFACAHIAAQELFRRAIAAYLHRPARLPLGWAIGRSISQYLDWEIMTYCAIVGIVLAATYWTEARDRAVMGAKLETRLVETQLQTLQRQLQPHFLFNTLHSISTLMHRDVDAADAMLSRLGELLRMTLDKVGYREVPLKEEVDFLDKYLEIERARFGSRLTVTMDVEPAALDAAVPWMLLQPLVENALKHGIARRAGGATVRVAARREGSYLLIEVEDDGPGLCKEAAVAMQRGIGLSTTRARLEYQYGRNFRFEFHGRSKGLRVLVALPWHCEAALATA